MGNFGKRLLIITLSALAIVALAIVGNTIQQSERIHTVKDSNEIVVGDITKGDLWDAIINSSISDTVNDNLDRALLSQVIEKVSDSEAKEYLNDMEYGEHYSEFFNNDGKEKANLSEEEIADKKEHEESYEYTMTALGYLTEDARKDYAKLQIAKRKYAEYRINNKLTIGAYDFDDLDLETNKDTWKDEIEDELEYVDAYALAIFFNSTDEANAFITSFVEESNVTESKLVYNSSYGLMKYAPVSYSDSKPQLNTLPTGWGLGSAKDTNYSVWTLTFTEGNTKKVYALNYVDGVGEAQGEFHQVLVETVTTESKQKDGDSEAVSYTKTVFELLTEDKEIEIKTSELSSDTTYLDKLAQNTSSYSENAKTGKLSDLASGAITTVAFDKDKATTSSYTNRIVGDNDFYLSVYTEMYNVYYEKLITIGLKHKFGINKDDFVLTDLYNNGYTVYNNQVVKYTGTESLGASTVLDSSNTKTLTQSELTTLFYTIYGVNSTDETNQNTIKANYFLYDLDTYSSTSTFGTSIYSTLPSNNLNATYKLSTSPYYLVYKLTDTTLNITDEDIENYRKEQIEELLDNSYFIDLCMAELKKEAKIHLYDQYLVYSYDDYVTYDSSNNVYGLEESDDIKKYYTKGLYSSTLIARVNNMNFTFDENNTITGCEKGKGKYKLTTDALYDYTMSLHKASYISTVKLNKTLLSMKENEMIHGTDPNFQTSTNWRMEEYKDSLEYYNYIYEYYKAYGYSTYSSLKEYLYSNLGVRSWDRLVTSYKQSTLKNFFLYYNLVNDDFNKTEIKGTTLDSMIDSNNDIGFNFQEIIDGQYSFYATHLLASLDLNNDQSNDDFEEFVKTSAYTDNYKNKLDELYTLALDYVANKGTYNSSYVKGTTTSDSAFNEFVTEYNNSDYLYGDYKEFKQLGIKLKYESLGEVTESTNFVEGFLNGTARVYKTISSDDNYNKASDYYIDSVYTNSVYGAHIIIASRNDDYTPISFGTKDEMKATVAKYMQYIVYTTVFGTTDNPESKSVKVFPDLKYPELDSETISNIETLFGDQIDMLLDQSTSYNATYITLKELVKDANEDDKVLYNALIKAVETAMFE